MTSSAQQRYLADAVSTASPVQLVVMLYDRLVLDVRRAADAQESSDIYAASQQIRHAQQILAELRSTLRTDQWAAGESLASLYGFIVGELIAVNIDSDVKRLRKVEEIVAGLRDSWRAAGMALLDKSKPAGSTPDGSDQSGIAGLKPGHNGPLRQVARVG